MGERPKLGRLLGAQDLVLGAGLLRGGSEATWLRARGVTGALDAAPILGGLSVGAFPKSRTAVVEERLRVLASPAAISSVPATPGAGPRRGAATR